MCVQQHIRGERVRHGLAPAGGGRGVVILHHSVVDGVVVDHHICAAAADGSAGEKFTMFVNITLTM
jgi:hypothetical protein